MEKFIRIDSEVGEDFVIDLDKVWSVQRQGKQIQIFPDGSATPTCLTFGDDKSADNIINLIWKSFGWEHKFCKGTN